MIKVFILDDETIARINLRHLINWEKEGYVICGEADNGADALKKAEELQPDIIFTDMNMAGMNGVEFINQVKRIVPSAKIIAFSAFDDFEFVRQSLKEGAVDYLIKYRMDAGSLLSMLESIKNSIRTESMERQKNDRIREMATSGKALVQKNVIMNSLNGYLKDNFAAIIKEYEIDLDDKNLIIAASRIDDFYSIKEKFNTQERAVFIQTVDNILTGICEDIGKTVYVGMDEGKYIFLMSFGDILSEAAIYSRAITNIGTIEGTVKRFLNVTLSFGLSGICPVAAKIDEYYREARKVLDDGYFKGSNYIVQKRELACNETPRRNTGLSAAEEKNLLGGIRNSKKDGVIKTLEDIFRSMKENKCPFDTVKMTCIDLINLLSRVIKEFNISSGKVFTSTSSPYDDFKKFENLEELLNYFKFLYTALLDVLEQNKLNSGYSPIIKKSIDYIINNYHSDISLSSVAEKVNVTPQYLSKLFKEECNEGFTYYLNSIRIEQAKQMLAEGINFKDLAPKAGFNNYTYFFTVFKEFTGMTPHQYEKTILKGKI
ncbi:response regulator [Ruminiclostridium cellobioparum]|jgi:two-component system response regulator YesN|uniref:response regulator n=1 Tax=Ruminiclostridium cellobioparum TaxID=29355 RepID=UPI0028AC4D5B|nr:response regulator [Ruminiclostridium cellobioparum]